MAQRKLIFVAVIILAFIIVSAFFLTDVEHYSFEKPSSVIVTFVENGLPSGQTWSVTVHENITAQNPLGKVVSASSTNTTIKMVVPNNNSTYTVTPPKGYVGAEKGGNITQSHYTQKSIDVTFDKLYNITFDEKGLPASSTWLLFVFAPESGSSPYGSTNLSNVYALNYTHTSNNVTIQLPNGQYSYSFEYQTLNTTYYPIYTSAVNVAGNALLNITGHSENIPVVLTTTTYKLHVNETGFPPGRSGWGFNISGSGSFGYWSSSANAYATGYYSLPNGTYYYDASTASGYSSTNSRGMVTINGSDSSLEVIYTK